MWQVVQKQEIMHYGKLEELVSLVTETVPELLSYRKRTQLILALRAKLILELCRSEHTADPHTIQLHLDRIRSPSVSPVHTGASDVETEESEANFLELVQTLLEDPAEREHFFQEVFPVQFGPKYDTALQVLVWEFLSRLEQLLPVPDLQQVLSHNTTTSQGECQHAVMRITLILAQRGSHRQEKTKLRHNDWHRGAQTTAQAHCLQHRPTVYRTDYSTDPLPAAQTHSLPHRLQHRPTACSTACSTNPQTAAQTHSLPHRLQQRPTVCSTGPQTAARTHRLQHKLQHRPTACSTDCSTDCSTANFHCNSCSRLWAALLPLTGVGVGSVIAPHRGSSGQRYCPSPGSEWAALLPLTGVGVGSVIAPHRGSSGQSYCPSPGSEWAALLPLTRVVVGSIIAPHW
ncbi:hypothetical protein JZ751_013986, partial [Albula glossodonta]